MTTVSALLQIPSAQQAVNTTPAAPSEPDHFSDVLMQLRRSHEDERFATDTRVLPIKKNALKDASSIPRDGAEQAPINVETLTTRHDGLTGGQTDTDAQRLPISEMVDDIPTQKGMTESLTRSLMTPLPTRLSPDIELAAVPDNIADALHTIQSLPDSPKTSSLHTVVPTTTLTLLTGALRNINAADHDTAELDGKTQQFVHTLEASLALLRNPDKSDLPAITPSTVTLPTMMINAPVQNPGWAHAFSQQVITFLRKDDPTTQHAQLRLDPPELGPLKVSISIKDGIATASFVSVNPAVRSAVEHALPLLASQLQDAGLSLGNTSVGSHDTAESSARHTHDSKEHRASRQHTDPEQLDSEDQEPMPIARPVQGLIHTYA